MASEAVHRENEERGKILQELERVEDRLRATLPNQRDSGRLNLQTDFLTEIELLKESTKTIPSTEVESFSRNVLSRLSYISNLKDGFNDLAGEEIQDTSKIAGEFKLYRLIHSQEWMNADDAEKFALSSERREEEEGNRRRAEFHSTLEQFNREFKERIKEVDNVLNFSKKLSADRATDVLAGAHEKHANSEKTLALVWTIVALVAAGVGALILAQALRDITATESISWQFLSAKAATAAVAIGIFGYIGKVAGGHRREEREARRVELTLRTIRPYLADLPEGEAIKIRQSTAERIFFPSIVSQDEEASTSNLSPAALTDLVIGQLRNITGQEKEKEK